LKPLHLSLIVLLTVASSALAACAQSPNCSSPKVVCVGLVTDTGGLQDYGLSQSAWDGIQRAHNDKLIQVASYIESISALDYQKNIDFFAQNGYNVVITSGIGLSDETLQSADRYPDTVFIGLDQLPDSSRPNFIAMTFPEDQEGFLAGALAALTTKTNIIGAVCETSNFDSIRRTCEGFRAGAAYINADIKILVNYRNNSGSENLFRDSTWGHDTALTEIQQGADIIFGVGGGTGEGALIAAAEQGVYAIGSEQDQFYVTREASSALIASVVPRADSGVYDLIGMIQKGNHPTEYDGQIGLTPYHELDARVSNEIKQKVLQIYAALSQGSLQTNISKEQTK